MSCVSCHVVLFGLVSCHSKLCSFNSVVNVWFCCQVSLCVSTRVTSRRLVLFCVIYRNVVLVCVVLSLHVVSFVMLDNSVVLCRCFVWCVVCCVSLSRIM